MPSEQERQRVFEEISYGAIDSEHAAERLADEIIRLRALFGNVELWLNSLNQLDSPTLSRVGIDDLGDLRDNVPSVRQWLDTGYRLLGDADMPNNSRQA